MDGLTLQYRDPFNLATPNIAISNSSSTEKLPSYDLFQPAEVIDIILDNKHPDYNNSYNIGQIKAKLLSERTNKNTENLITALPINNNMVSYPLIGEIVLVIKIIDKYFYLFSINYLNDVEKNVLKGESISSKEITPTVIENSKIEDKEYEKLKVKILNPENGDFVIRGRKGNNIRFSSTRSEIKISIGQDSKNKNAEYLEDINKDSASIWITENNKIDIDLATKGKSYYLKSAKNAPEKFEGSQVAINAGRLIFNSKSNEVIISGERGLLFNTNGYISIDSNDYITLNSSKKVNVIATDLVEVDCKKINLGKDANEPLVLGNKLVEILNELLDAIMEETHTTGTGPSGPPINIAKFRAIKNKLSRTILSKQNKTL